MDHLNKVRYLHEQPVQEYSNTGQLTKRSGFVLVKALANANYCIARRVVKLAATSSLVHGIEHEYTKKAGEILKRSKARIIAMSVESNKAFQALRYEDDGENCVVKGPILEPRILKRKQCIFSKVILFCRCWAVQSFAMD